MKLNLLPEEKKKKLLSRNLNKIIAGFVTLGFVCVFVVAGVLFLNDATQEKELKIVEDKIAIQQKKNEKYEETEKETQMVFKITDDLKKAEEKRISFGKLLSELAVSTPQNVQITSFLSKDGSKFTIKGSSKDVKTVMIFKEKLELSKNYKSAEMEVSEYFDERGNYDFIINLSIENIK